METVIPHKCPFEKELLDFKFGCDNYKDGICNVGKCPRNKEMYPLKKEKIKINPLILGD